MRAASRAKCSGGFVLEELGPDATAAAGAALAPHALLGRDHGDADREERLHVLDQDAGGVRDPNLLRLVAEA